MKILPFFLLLINICNIAQADDWQDWRGPHRDGKWSETGIIQKFESSGIKIKWSVPIGSGYNGPSVSEGKVYVMDRKESPVETERVICFDEKTGAKIWSSEYDCKYEEVGYPAGPRSSVIIDGPSAYSLSTMGHLHCFDKVSGKVLWKKNLREIYKIKMPIWGLAAAPLIVDNKIIIQAAGSNNACVVALNKIDGN